MSLNNPLRTTSWFSKFLEFLYVYIALAGVSNMLLTPFFYKHLHLSGESLFFIIIYWAGPVFILLTLVYSVYWHRKERSGAFNSEIRHAWLRGVMRYFLAFDISIYGFGKIFKTQFGHLYSRDDLPIGNLNGFELTWNYFGHSHTFAVILGLLQIGGSILLLFRRTTLPGVFILLPVMVNIVLIDIFYQIPTGALINALIITFGLLYLLLLRWNDLKALFFNKTAETPVMPLEFLKPLVRFLTIAAAFFYIYQIIANIPPTVFEGKWKVDEYKRNGKLIDKNDWQTNSKSWCRVYIETWGQLSLSPNPYIFDNTRAWFGSYQYDAGKKILKIVFKDTQTDTTKVKISNNNEKEMQWNTVVYGDTLQMKLIKEK
jgi:hypothetical protein